MEEHIFMKLDDKIELENIDLLNEDTTKYGEFVSSYFAWLTLEKQKDKANQMDNMTKKKEP